PSRTSRTVTREHPNARAISRIRRPSFSRRSISLYRSTVNFLRAIATPSPRSRKTANGTGPNRSAKRLAQVGPIRGNRVGPISGNQVVLILGNWVGPIRGNFAQVQVRTRRRCLVAQLRQD